MLYHYFLPPVWGFISVRLETWFPFPVHISPHGREWLAPPMDGAGIRYRRHHNCFTSVENRERAPALPNQQWHTHWVPLFDPWVHHRAVVWQPAWDRYCCARAARDDTSTLEELTAVVERSVR